MRILVFISILFCKLSGFILRIAGRGGTNLPGKIALKICPNVLRYMSRGVTTLVVTGTNGKTTTSRMLEECYKRAGFDYFANKSGANLLSGVTAEFARSSNLFGKNRHKYALIECDEAAFKQVGLSADKQARVKAVSDAMAAFALAAFDLRPTEVFDGYCSIASSCDWRCIIYPLPFSM